MLAGLASYSCFLQHIANLKSHTTLSSLAMVPVPAHESLQHSPALEWAGWGRPGSAWGLEGLCP